MKVQIRAIYIYGLLCTDDDRTNECHNQANNNYYTSKRTYHRKLMQKRREDNWRIRNGLSLYENIPKRTISCILKRQLRTNNAVSLTRGGIRFTKVNKEINKSYATLFRKQNLKKLIFKNI